MLFDEKRIYKNNIALLLILALVLTGLFSCSAPAYAITVEKAVTKYHLDIGAQHIWGAGSSVGTAVWEKGSNKGGPIDVSISLEFPQEVSDVRVYELTSGNFNWGQAGYSFNPTMYLHNKDNYDDNYKQYVSTSIYNISASFSGNTINLSYTATLDSSEDFDLKTNLNMGRLNYILDMLGGAESVQEHYPEVYERLVEGAEHGIADDVYGFMYFTPVVIAYDVIEMVEVGDFEPGLDLPEAARQGEEYTAADATIVDGVTEIDYAALEKHYGDGHWEEAAFWGGPGVPGENTGGEVTESCDDVGTVTYRLRVYDIAGQQKSVTKSINITDSREISVTPVLSLPAYTYEGHPALAEDNSTFVVNGVDYSAARAYAENIADNSFHPSGSYGSVSRLTDTKANVTFTRAGNYTVKLAVDPAGGKTVYDTKPIEVRTTPYIIDELSGFQKQNRKQILNVAVATSPGNPVMDFSITLKDKKTGGIIILTPDAPRGDNATIKTRAVRKTESENGCYTYLTVEFLTKTPVYNPADPDDTQDFYYEIHVKDSKGDTDDASKTFTVSPDLPPAAAISLDSVFLRNEGTNTASIKAEDITVASDGDSVERVWSYASGTVPQGTAPEAFTDISTMDGYKKLSFGTDKIVGFNKVGVGRFTARLDVKEVWTEPTLEEYVTDADHLTGSASAISDVQNVAPVVSLELLDSTEQEILLLASNDTEYQTLLNRKTALQQELLANKVDGRIIIKKLVGSTPGTVTGVQQQRGVSYPYPAKPLSGGLATEVNESKLLAVDSTNIYFLTYTWSNGTPTVPKTVHAIRSFGSGEAWSYTTSRDEDFTFGQDDTGKYLYLIYKDSNQTVLLDKSTGAAAGTINIALSDKVWLSDNLAFITENNNLYAINLNSLTKTLIAGSASAVSRVGGNLQYIEKTTGAIVRGTLDMETLEADRDIIVDIVIGASSLNNYIPVCIDSTGKAVIFKNAGRGADSFRGIQVYSPDNRLIKSINVEVESELSLKEIYPSFDEQGKCNHVFLREDTGDQDDSIIFKGVEINTGTAAATSKKGSSYWGLPYAGSFQSGGTSYYMFEGWYIYPGSIGHYGNNYTFSFNGSSVGVSAAVPGTSGTLDENIKVSDRTIAALNGDNNPSGGTFALKIIAFPRTFAQETTEIISRFTDKLTFLGNVNTTANQIIAAAEAPKPTIMVAATKDGYLSLNNLSLQPEKKYYYEYEIKPLTKGTENRLTGMSAVTGTITSGQSFLSNTYYVQKTYEEDFNDSSINGFFTVVNAGLFVNGFYGIRTGTNDNDDSSCKMTFDVPAGKQAILQFDYWRYFKTRYFRDSIYVDGERMYEDLPAADGYGEATVYGHCVFQRILSSGTHTIEFKGSSYSPYNIMMDNLKVDIISGTAPAFPTTSYTQAGEDKGWLDVDGSFTTPNKTISYGAQASTYSSGPISSAVLSTFNNGAPRETAYYQTVPSGYLQRSFAYPQGNGSADEKETHIFTLDGIEYRMIYKGDISSGEKMYLNTKGAGTYTHKARAANKYTYANIPRFDRITYPVNAVTATGNIVFDNTYTKYYFPKMTSAGKTNLSIFLPKGEYLIRNLKLYYIEDGRKIYLQNRDLGEAADLSGWTLSSGLTASVYAEAEEEQDDEFIKIYKKGERVLYNIFYDDYEEDPSKQQYWRYAHINWPPDGVHPDAGRVLNNPIDRFYLSGKYTVTHWQRDNTQRTGTVEDAGGYNKESNQVQLVFYVDGDGNAPWVTYIKTNPPMVKENNTYTLAVGVDDWEKDTLTLETEVYYNGKSIFTHRRENLQANAAGDYPETLISGLPQAKVGVYQVVCTVSDLSGTGVRAYKFTVVSEGRITGFVNHTEQWDVNRKKYNLKRFSEEVNRVTQIGDYIAMPVPRMRGVNVFWSGERFMLRAETEGEAERVSVQILSPDPPGGLINTGYSTELANTGRKTETDAKLWEGSLWDSAMINKWGRRDPEELIFRFTAYYPEGVTKTHTVSVIMDSERDYWQLHRLW